MAPPSPLYRQYDRLLQLGFPPGELFKELLVRTVPLSNPSGGSALEQWIKSRGRDNYVEKEVNQANRMSTELKKLEKEWEMWRREETKQREARLNPGLFIKILRPAVFFLAMFLFALLCIVGVEEVHSKHIPRLMQFLRNSGVDPRSAMMRQHPPPRNNNNNNNNKPSSASSSSSASSMLPDPPAGTLSWSTWLLRQTGLREFLGGLKGKACTCGEFTPQLFVEEDEEEEKNKKQPQEGAAAAAEPSSVEKQNDEENPSPSSSSATTTKEEEQEQQEQSTAAAEESEEAAPTTAAEETTATDHHHVHEEETPPSRPSLMGRKFLTRAGNLFRKASGMINPEDTVSSSFSHNRGDDIDSSGAGAGAARGENAAEKKKLLQRKKGVLQPAFLLEASEVVYRTHVEWLSQRFEPSLPVVELVWEDIKDVAHISDFLWWNTGWGGHHHHQHAGSGGGGGGGTGCCVIFSIPNAIAPIARVRNATRSSALPFLIERLTSVAKPESAAVQANAGCKLVVVARADPTTPEIRKKKTYKRLTNMFSSMIL